MSSLRDELLTIYQAQGKLTPSLVVDEARPEDHPLHSRFEWDDAIAGESYREIQAAALIRSVEIVFTDRKGNRQKVREFWAIERREDSGYQQIEKVMEDELTTTLLLRQAEREWKDLKTRYGHLQEFLAFVKADVA